MTTGHSGALRFRNALLVRGRGISLCLVGPAPHCEPFTPARVLSPSKNISAHIGVVQCRRAERPTNSGQCVLEFLLSKQRQLRMPRQRD